MNHDSGFAQLQRRLPEAWEAQLPGSSTPHLIVVLPSFSVDPSLLMHYAARLPALEQRYLYSVLNAVNPATHVVFLCSQPVPEYLVQYFFSLVPWLDADEAHKRVTLLTVDDLSPRPLAPKLLTKPELMEQIRDLAGDRIAMLEPWNVTESERDVAVALDMPVYGASPELWRLASKSGGRELFLEEGVPTPTGVENVTTLDDVVDAIRQLRAQNDELRAVVVKLDGSGAGDGNVVIDLSGLPVPGAVGEPTGIMQRLHALSGWYVHSLTAGGIVEELIEADEFRSPSVQLAITPTGEVVVLSTHDQILGGHAGQVYQGCRFPADPAYAAQISEYGETIGRRLAREGVVGRLGIDFATVPINGRWDSYALEINLRKGGTTHPYGILRSLMGGGYSAAGCCFVAPDGAARYYIATDNLIDAAWQTLDPTEVIARVEKAGLAYDAARRVGVVLHMLECLPIDGRLGLTAIGSSREQARQLYAAVSAALS